MNQPHKSLPVTIITTGLLVGFLDGLAAVIQTLLNNGNPVKVFQYIASSILGTEAFSGGSSTAILGLILHFIVAFIWAVIFFLIYPNIKIFSKHAIATAILYGIIIWVGMTFVVLPLSRVPTPSPTLRGAITSTLILIVAIGFPLSFIARRYYVVKE